MACLMAGMLGCGSGPPILFPSRCREAAGLEKGVGDHLCNGQALPVTGRRS